MKTKALVWSTLVMTGTLGCSKLSSDKRAAGNEQAVKQEAEALRQSGVRLANFDRDTAPSENFYKHVNGSWLKATQLPADKSNYGVFTILDDLSQDRLKAMIDEIALKDSSRLGADEQKIKDLYASFMNTEVIEHLGLAPIAPLLADIGAIADKDALAAFFAKTGALGFSAPLGLGVALDFKDPGKHVVYLSQAGLSLGDRDRYLIDEPDAQELREDFVRHVARMFSLAGLPDPEASAQLVLRLETAMARHHWSQVELRDREKTYNPTTPATLQQLMPSFAWEAYLQQANVASETQFIVRTPSYLQALDKLMSTTPLADWQAYLRWQLLTAYAPFMPSALADESFAFFGVRFKGVKEQLPRWRRGVQLVDGVLGEPLGQEYVKRYFKPEAKLRMEALIENLRAAYRQSIQELDWMSARTKEQALDKLQKFRPKVGYPSTWRSFADLTIKNDELVANLLRAEQFEYQYQIARLGKPVDPEEWSMTPQTVNAYYSVVRNEIVFPAAILQPPFFDLAADDAVNYGAIGAVIGHEMGHGFDDQGAKFDGNGKMQNWWTDEDLKAFQARTARLVAQYNQYEPLPGQFVKGDFTLGENIGDLGGVSIAYKAYHNSLKGKDAPVLDGFTGDQRFFIGWAQVWPRKHTDEDMSNRLLMDPHSPSEYRVNGVLSNIPAFYDAFAVQADAAMYLPPSERVKIW